MSVSILLFGLHSILLNKPSRDTSSLATIQFINQHVTLQNHSNVHLPLIEKHSLFGFLNIIKRMDLIVTYWELSYRHTALKRKMDISNDLNDINESRKLGRSSLEIYEERETLDKKWMKLEQEISDFKGYFGHKECEVTVESGERLGLNNVSTTLDKACLIVQSMIKYYGDNNQIQFSFQLE